MVIGEYVVKCPNCSTEVRLVAEMVSPIMVFCHGCERTVIMNNNTTFTLPHEYVVELCNKHGIRYCGNVLSTQVSNTAKQLINGDKIQKLHRLLSQNIDVQDFINKINR